MTEQTELALRFWKTLFTLTDQLRERTISRHSFSREWNITLQQLRLLRFLERLMKNNPDGVMLKTLAEALHVSPAAASGMVETLVQRDILTRKAGIGDRRSVRITLSKTSARKLEQVSFSFNALSCAMIRAHGEEKISELVSALETLSEHFDEDIAACPDLFPQDDAAGETPKL